MNDDEFISHVKKTLDQQTKALDGETLSKLNQARQLSLQQAQQPLKQRSPLAWAPLGGIAAALLLTSIFMFKSDELTNLSDNPVDEIEIIASSDNLDLYEQLDFYLWLLEENAGAV